MEALIGQSLPEVILSSSEGKDVKIPEDFRGRYSVLFFYPKDMTPGCTKEACSFRDLSEDFKALNVDVFGVSADTLDSHQRFIDKYALNFPLLSDPKKILAKKLSAISFLGIISRDTFLIDKDGKILKIWRKVDATKTAQEVLNTLRDL